MTMCAGAFSAKRRRLLYALLELESGYNGEVQFHTESSWALKEASDKNYGIARVLDISDPQQQATKKALSEKTLKSYQSFWDAVPDSTKELISPWETGDISSHEEAGKGEGPGTQRPSTSSITPGSPLLPNRNTRPDSGQRAALGNEESGERISEPPGANIPQDEDKDSPRFSVAPPLAAGLNRYDVSGAVLP